MLVCGSFFIMSEALKAMDMMEGGLMGREGAWVLLELKKRRLRVSA